MANRNTVLIDSAILVVRGHRVILAADLAKMYGVDTRVLNQAVSAIGRDFLWISRFG